MQIGGESFHNRSQTKSKALFIILFLIIGTFLIFKLTQDGSKYASPFGTAAKDDVHLPEKPKNSTNETAELEHKKEDAKNRGILKNLVDQMGTFNETIEKFDEQLRNFTSLLGGNSSIASLFNNDTGDSILEKMKLGKYEEEKNQLLNNQQQLKDAFEKASNGTNRFLNKKL